MSDALTSWAPKLPETALVPLEKRERKREIAKIRRFLALVDPEIARLAAEFDDLRCVCFYLRHIDRESAYALLGQTPPWAVNNAPPMPPPWAAVVSALSRLIPSSNLSAEQVQALCEGNGGYRTARDLVTQAREEELAAALTPAMLGSLSHMALTAKSEGARVMAATATLSRNTPRKKATEALPPPPAPAQEAEKPRGPTLNDLFAGGVVTQGGRT